MSNPHGGHAEAEVSPMQRTLTIVLLIILFLFLGVFFRRYEQLRVARPDKASFLAAVLSFFDLDAQSTDTAPVVVPPHAGGSEVPPPAPAPRPRLPIIGISEIVSGTSNVYAEGNSFILQQGMHYAMQVRLFNVSSNGNLDYIVRLTGNNQSFVLAQEQGVFYVDRKFVTRELNSNFSGFNLPIGNYTGEVVITGGVGPFTVPFRVQVVPSASSIDVAVYRLFIKDAQGVQHTAITPSDYLLTAVAQISTPGPETGYSFAIVSKDNPATSLALGNGTLRDSGTLEAQVTVPSVASLPSGNYELVFRATARRQDGIVGNEAVRKEPITIQSITNGASSNAITRLMVRDAANIQITTIYTAPQQPLYGYAQLNNPFNDASYTMTLISMTDVSRQQDFVTGGSLQGTGLKDVTGTIPRLDGAPSGLYDLVFTVTERRANGADGATITRRETVTVQPMQQQPYYGGYPYPYYYPQPQPQPYPYYYYVPQPTPIPTPTPTSFALTLNISPANGNSVTVNPPGGTFTASTQTINESSGASVTLTATAVTGQTFSSWSDGVTTNPRTITMSAAMTLGANFITSGGNGGGGGGNATSIPLTVTISPANGNTVRVNPPNTVFNGVTQTVNQTSGTSVVLTATAATGQTFSSWSDGVTTNPRTITVNATTTIGAAFAATVLGDGNATFSGSTNLNTDTRIAGRNCADGGDAVNYSVTVLSATTATLLSAPSSGCLAVNDEVVLINLQGNQNSYANVGNYELLKVQSIAGNVVTFTTAKTRSYGDASGNDNNIGVNAFNQRVMLQRVPNYQRVVISAGSTLTANPWNGTKGGVLMFRALQGIQNAGAIRMSGLGYRGGATTINASGAGGGYQGESYGGVGVITSSNNLSGGGGCLSNRSTGGGGALGTAGTAGGTAGGCGGASGVPASALLGNINLSQKLLLGSGGGGNYDYDGCTNGGARPGGNGGGIIGILGTLENANGSIENNGGAGATNTGFHSDCRFNGIRIASYGSGGGAGGSIFTTGGSGIPSGLTLTANGGAAGPGSIASGGAGGLGIISTQ